MGAQAPPPAGGPSPAFQQSCLAAEVFDDVNQIPIASPGNLNDDFSSRSQCFECVQ